MTKRKRAGVDSLFADPAHAWDPYRPSTEAPWDVARVAHLHRRTGFAANWAQLERDLKEGYEQSLRRVLEGASADPSGLPASEFAATIAAMDDSIRRRPSIERVQMLWLYRLVFTPFPLQEVMTLAWHNHYATSQTRVNSPELMHAQQNAQRELWRGPISKLHTRMLKDAAMRRWLDGLNSTKSQPNENLGREFLELFALGEGHYTERDVRAAARALTGWREIDFQTHEDRLVPGEFDSDDKTILGETGPWGLDDLVRIACRQPAAATHIARRLFRTFIGDTEEPSAELLAPLAAAMRTDGDVDVAKGIELVLRSRLFHSESVRGRRVKSPVEYAIGIIRACELFAPPPDPVDLEIHLTKMGQRLFYPPSVAGWPGGLAWLGGQELVARANFAAWVTESSPHGGNTHFDALAARRGLQGHDRWRGALATLLLGSPLEGTRRASLDRAPGLAAVTCELISLPQAQLS